MTTDDKLKHLTVEQLVSAFTAAAVEQSRADLYGKYAKYNRLYRQIDSIQKELKQRAGDQRSALVPLFDHPNPQVRWIAAELALAVAPAAARQVLQDLSDKNIYPQAADARGTLESLAAGRRKPT